MVALRQAARVAEVEDANGHPAMVARVIAALRAEPATLTLGDMADLACLSPFHFSRVFHRVVGVPPAAFQAALRLERAKRLLLTTPLSVTDVCFEVGYTSLGTFTTRFTRAVGQSPGQLRRTNERFDPSALAWLRDPERNPFRSPASPLGVSGRVVGPAGVRGPIFVGLFPQRQAQDRPTVGTVLVEPGPFHLPTVPDGDYHALCAAPGLAADPRAFLLPDAAVPVGAARGPVSVRGGRATGEAVIFLRQGRPTDPPVLISMPMLLEEGLAARGVKFK